MVEKKTMGAVLRAIGRVLVKVGRHAFITVLAAESEIFPQFWAGLLYAGELSGHSKMF